MKPNCWQVQVTLTEELEEDVHDRPFKKEEVEQWIDRGLGEFEGEGLVVQEIIAIPMFSLKYAEEKNGN